MVKLSKLGARRLLKLAEHLEKGKLGHKQFDYSTYHIGPRDKNHCGTAGCAIGECPVVFPRQWKFIQARYSDVPILRAIDSDSTEDSGAVFFGLTYKEYEYLFIPGTEENPLSENAKRKTVAKHIRNFVTRRLAGKPVIKEHFYG